MRIVHSILLTLMLVGPARAQESDIQAVIGDQFAAFKTDDFATAFTFASPAIRQVFRSPENFGLMVREGYPMVWRPDSVAFLGLRREDGRIIQRLAVTDRQGGAHVLDYDMIQTEDGWRINGVRLVRGAVPSV